MAKITELQVAELQQEISSYTVYVEEVLRYPGHQVLSKVLDNYTAKLSEAQAQLFRDEIDFIDDGEQEAEWMRRLAYAVLVYSMSLE